MDKDAGIINLGVKRQIGDNVDTVSITLGDGIAEASRDYLEIGVVVGVKAAIWIDDNILRIFADKYQFY